MNVLDILPNTISGLSATVFEDTFPNNGQSQLVLSIRGSELPLTDPISEYVPDLFSDIGVLKSRGIAITQVIDLFNYYQRLTAHAGDTVVQYAYSPEVVTLDEPPQVEPATVRFTTFTATEDGVLAGKRFVVTGHSLGGHLALALSRLAPASIDEVVTFNALPFDHPDGEALSESFYALVRDAEIRATGSSQVASGYDTSSITNVVTEKDVIHDLGTLPGPQVTLFSEAGNWLTAHRIAGMTDTLAVAALLADLDPSMTLERSNAILAAAANQRRNSLASVVNAVGDLFETGSPVMAKDRDGLHARILALRGGARNDEGNPIPASAAFQDAKGTLQVVDLARTGNGFDLAAAARGEIAYRYALLHLNGFALLGNDAIYAPHNLNGELETGRFSDAWLRDRAAFLDVRLRLAVADATVLDGASEDITYVDQRSGLVLEQFDAVDSPGIDPTRYVFGTDDSDWINGAGGNDRLYGDSDADLLSGGAGDDWIEGGEGRDLIDGGPGDDRLDGGDGQDRYLVRTGSGNDTIHDADGTGAIFFDRGAGRLLPITGGQREGSGDTYRSIDGSVSYSWSGNPGDDLVVSFGARGDTVTVSGFEQGRLGIVLLDAPTPDPDLVINGDRQPIDIQPATPGLQIGYDSLGNVLVDPDTVAFRADTLIGGADAEIIRAGQRDDVVTAGAGNDLVEGGAGSDIITGESGDDRLFAGSEADLAGLFDSDDQAPGATRDWLAGGAGDDLLGGSDGDDGLSGGAGDDLIAGGAGDDNLFGDADWVALSTDWSFTEGPDGGRVFSGVIGNPAPAGAGADLLDGGGGDDHVWAGPGADTVSGAGGDDVLLGEAGDDQVAGGSGDDRIYGDGAAVAPGEHGDDLLDGGDGNDVIVGGGGSDIILAGAGDDQVLADQNGLDAAFHGNDIADGGPGDDLLIGGGGSDVLSGGDGDDRIDGDAADLDAADHGDDTIDGGPGADTLFGSGGDDRLDGGEGDDALYGDAAGIDPIYQGDDILAGGPGDDLLVGGGGDDVADGGEGADRIDGDAADLAAADHGDDFLDGGAGPDAIWGSGGSDVLLGGPGDDRLYGDGASIETAYHGDDYLDGGEGDDLLVGDGGGDILAGGPGDDRLEGDAPTLDGALHGADALYGEAGDDELTGSGGDDLLDGGDGDDRLYGDSSAVDPAFHGDDVLAGGAGNDLLVGGGGSDLLAGGSGDDRLAGDSADTPLAFQGDDYLDGGSGDDYLDGGAGADVLGGGIGDDTLDGGAGDDRLAGGDGADWLRGGDGADALDGGAGPDLLEGGAGDDTLEGGPGQDVFVYRRGDGVDEIRDGGSNTLRFGAGIALADLSLGLGSLAIRIGDGGDAVHIAGFDPDDPLAPIGVDRFELADGTTLDYAGLLALGFDLQGTPGDDRIDGTALVDRIDGLAGDDLLRGKAGDDVLAGGGGADRLEGGPGNDRLDGGPGADTLRGGPGDDVYLDLEPGDVVVELAGEGHDRIESATSLTLPDGVEDLWLTGSGDTAATGNALANELRGNAGANTLAGREGDDRILAGAGDDLLAGGAGDDLLDGGAGDDLLDGGTGADRMSGGTGDDTYRVDEAGDVVIERPGEGRDEVRASVSLALAANVEDLILLGSAALEGRGNRLDNVIVGNDGANVLHGLDGSDELAGGAGADWLDGGRGADRMRGGTGDDSYRVDHPLDRVVEQPGEGDDTVLATVSYTLPAEVERLVLLGTALAGTGNALANTLTGNALANLLDGAAGADTLIGAEGDDLYRVDDSADQIIERPGQGHDTVTSSATFALPEAVEDLTLSGNAAIDGTGNALANRIRGNDAANRLAGLGGDDLLEGGAGADILEGGAGADELDGGAGDDRLLGGPGDDRYRVDSAADQVVEAPGEGHDTVASEVSFALPAEVEDLELTGFAPIAGTGNALANRLIGNPAANRLAGGAGDDWLDGGPGADLLSGGPGDDHYRLDDPGDWVLEAPGEGHDSVEGSVSLLLPDAVEDGRLTGLAPLAATGNALANTLTGNDADNVLAGLAGDDVIDGAAGADWISGGDGDDRLYGGDDPTVLLSDYERLLALSYFRNDDWLEGGAGNDRIDGGSGDDMIFGGPGDDDLYGGDDGTGLVIVDDRPPGDEGGMPPLPPGLPSTNFDWIDGGPGDDRIDGGSDVDLLFGGEGRDFLIGGSGGDLLDGGAGIDTLLGGTGNDFYAVDGYAVTVEPPPGDGPGGDPGQPSPASRLAALLEALRTPPPGGGYNVMVDPGPGPHPSPGDDDDEDEDRDPACAEDGHGEHEAGGQDRDEGHEEARRRARRHGVRHQDEDDDREEGQDPARGSHRRTPPGKEDDEHRHHGEERRQSEHPARHHEEAPGEGRQARDEHDEDHNECASGERRYGEGHSVGEDDQRPGEEHDPLRYRRYAPIGDDLDLTPAPGGGSGAPGGPRVVYVTDEVIEQPGEGIDYVEALITYTLTPNVEGLVLGAAGPQDGTGNAGDNLIQGNAWANVIDGGAGADTLAGGAGDDTYVVDDPLDRVIELPGEGNDTVRAGLDWTLGEALENLVLTGEADLAGTGNALANTLTGNAGDNLLVGAEGDDRLDGGPGDDRLDGGPGDDTYLLDRAGGRDRIEDSAGLDTVQLAGDIAPGDVAVRIALDGGAAVAHLRLRDAAGNELAGSGLDIALDGTGAGGSPIERFAFADGTTVGLGELVVAAREHDGTAARDWILTGGADDTIRAGRGGDRVFAGPGNDHLLGEAGEDALYGEAGDDRLEGGRGDDGLYGGHGNDRLDGGKGDDDLYGSAGADLLAGGRGADYLDGGSGADLLAGGPGDDGLRPGGGPAVVLFNRGDGRDRVALDGGLERLTLSLGGGIELEDIALRSSDGELIIELGRGERAHGRGHGGRDALVLEGWEEAGAARPELVLQVVTAGQKEHEDDDAPPGTAQVSLFDLGAVVRRYEAAREARDGEGEDHEERWKAVDALLAARLAGGEDEAIGAAIAVRYALGAELAALPGSLTTALLADPRLGREPQPLGQG